MDAKKLWNVVLEKMDQKISKTSFETWFKGTTIEIDEDVVIVKASNFFASQWLERHYKTLIFETVREITGRTYDIEFTEQEENFMVEKNQSTTTHVEHVVEQEELIYRKHKEILERLLKEEFYSDALAMRLFDIPEKEILKMKSELEVEYKYKLLIEKTVQNVKRDVLKHLLMTDHHFSDDELMYISMLSESDVKEMKKELEEKLKKETC